MDLQRFWEWFYSSPAIDVLRNAKYAIPLIQSFHLFGLTLVLGTVVIFNARLLGIGMGKITPPVIANQLWRITLIGLLLSITTGILVFIPDPARYASNTAFKTKLVILIASILFHFTFFRKAIRSTTPTPRGRAAAVAAVSLTLWFGVGWAGRAIAFLG
ncbi:MAG: hypothetical protein C5B51_09475 [Terriglobia bacterium]|nr:MAG: hypothetical protein C5B51_09475 [Terriglobia bacterium]